MDSQTLINDAQTNILSQKSELLALQDKYNTTLKKYQDANANLQSAMKSFVNTDRSGTSTDITNTVVLVDKLIDDPTGVDVSYIGAFETGNISDFASVSYNGTSATKDDVVIIADLYDEGNGVMTAKYGYDYESCKNAAIKNGKTIFGLASFNQNEATADPTQAATCIATNNTGFYTSATPVTANKCNIDKTDGKYYGGEYTNAVYQINADGTTQYDGCYNDSTDRAMNVPGINIDVMPSVYIASDYNSGPWGKNTFPDTTAQWIWYTPDAVSGAPTNTNAPVSLIYNYTNNTGEYRFADLYIMVDDIATVFLNGTQVGGTINAGWATAGMEPNVLNAVRFQTGDNILAIQCINGGGPAGMCMTAMSNDAVLFHSDGTWKYTTEPPSQLYPPNPTNSFTFRTCKDEAEKYGYSYFGLQDGKNGSAQCFVSNDFSELSKYGETPGTTDFLNHTYGGYNTVALYNVNNLDSQIQNMGKVGYVDMSGKLSEMPASNLTMDKSAPYSSVKNVNTFFTNVTAGSNEADCAKACDDDANCSSYYLDANNACFTSSNTYSYPNVPLGSSSTRELHYKPFLVSGLDTSCSNKVANISADTWASFPNTGTTMTPITKCGLPKYIEKQELEVQRLRKKLFKVTSELVDKIKYLGTLNENIVNQIGIDKDVFSTDFYNYEKVMNQLQNNVQNNVSYNEIIEQTQMTATMSNYHFIFWAIVAVCIIIFLFVIYSKG